MERKKIQRDICAFLIPVYRTPLITSEMIFTLAKMKDKYLKCSFVIITDNSDKYMNAYPYIVRNARKMGLNVGYYIVDGCLYPAKINNLATIVSADFVCAVDSSHIPYPTNDKPIAETIASWASGINGLMRIGYMGDTASYPVVGKKFIERVGYLYHPICRGRMDAENWINALGNKLGLTSKIPDCAIIQSKEDVSEFDGYSTEEDIAWSGSVLSNVLDEESEELSQRLVK